MLASSEEITLEGNGDSIAPLEYVLEQQFGCTVIDNTKRTEGYDFTLSLPDDMILGPAGMRYKLTGNPHQSGGNKQPQDSAALLSSALQEQLGLKLVAQTKEEDVIVIDKLNEPATN
jgi:uncharacterized protein (TIGR03435 family)